jgi:hypothetical protein
MACIVHMLYVVVSLCRCVVVSCTLLLTIDHHYESPRHYNAIPNEQWTLRSSMPVASLVRLEYRAIISMCASGICWCHPIRHWCQRFRAMKMEVHIR